MSQGPHRRRLRTREREGCTGSFLVVDWKSGQPVAASDEAEKPAYFATQLRLYRRVWAAAWASILRG